MEDLEKNKKEKLSIDVVWANLFGLLILTPILFLYGIPTGCYVYRREETIV